MQTPLISVVLATFNRREILARTLEALFAQDMPPETFEVVVAVDGSTDGTQADLRNMRPACGWKVLELAHGERAAARNAAIAAASGELLLFLDDDTVCAPNVLSQHWKAHQGRDQLVCVGRIVTEPPPSRSTPSIGNEWIWLLDAELAAGTRGGETLRWPQDIYLWPNCSMRRRHLAASGGFDEKFYGAREDAEFGLRLWKLGMKFEYLPSAVATQVYVKSDEDVALRDAHWNGHNEVLLTRKHPEYRPHCWPSRLQEGGALKRLIRQFVARLPFSIEPLVRPAFWALSALRQIPAARSAAVRLLQVRAGIVLFRAASRAAGGRRALETEFGQKLPVLLYHRVGPPRAGTMASLTVSPRKFARHMRALKRWGYTPIRVEDWRKWVQEAKPLPPKPVLLTFDDAYEDLREHAFPVLEKLGFTATVFAVTSELGGRNSWDTARGHEELRLLGAEAMREWTRRGIEFGAHSHTHADLRELSPARLEEEATTSKTVLAQALGQAVDSFAYPYGDANDQVRSAVGREFAVACTADPGLNLLRTDLLALRRTMVLPTDTLLDLWLRLKLGDSPWNNLRARVRLRTRLKRLFAAEPA